ncbi:hypothetical protein ECTW09098_1793, partial [Escherichia coli TW09098]
MTWFDGVDARC